MRETPREMTLCESSALSRCGRVTVDQVPAPRGRRATTAWRLAVYQAAYWVALVGQQAVLLEGVVVDQAVVGDEVGGLGVESGGAPVRDRGARAGRPGGSGGRDGGGGEGAGQHGASSHVRLQGVQARWNTSVSGRMASSGRGAVQCLKERRHLRLPAGVDVGGRHGRLGGGEVLRLQIADEQAVLAQEQRVVVPAGGAFRASSISGQTAACRARYSSSRSARTFSRKHTRCTESPLSLRSRTGRCCRRRNHGRPAQVDHAVLADGVRRGAGLEGLALLAGDLTRGQRDRGPCGEVAESRRVPQLEGLDRAVLDVPAHVVRRAEPGQLDLALVRGARQVLGGGLDADGGREMIPFRSGCSWSRPWVCWKDCWASSLP